MYSEQVDRMWFDQDYDITHDQSALEVIQTNKTQIYKRIKHKLIKIPKIIRL